MTDSLAGFNRWWASLGHKHCFGYDDCLMAWQAAEAETARRCVELCEKAEIQTVAAKGRETAARLKVAIKAEFPEAFK